MQNKQSHLSNHTSSLRHTLALALPPTHTITNEWPAVSKHFHTAESSTKLQNTSSTAPSESKMVLNFFGLEDDAKESTEQADHREGSSNQSANGCDELVPVLPLKARAQATRTDATV